MLPNPNLRPSAKSADFLTCVSFKHPGHVSQASGGSVAFYLGLARHLAEEDVECHTGLMDYNADWLAGRLPKRIGKHRISVADTAEGARNEARYAEEIGSDWMLFLFPHADDAYETAPGCAQGLSGA